MRGLRVMLTNSTKSVETLHTHTHTHTHTHRYSLNKKILKKNNGGISLITLMITIVIIVILAGAVILTVANNNMIDQANEAVFRSNIATIQEEFEMYKMDELLKGNRAEDINLGEIDRLKETLSSIKDYANILTIMSGKLYYAGNDEKEREILISMGIEQIDYRVGVSGNLISLVYQGGETKINFVIPAHIKGIESGAFKDNTALESIDFSQSSITEIPDNAFENCTSLKEIIWGDNITKIGEDSFSNCTNLKYLKIPESVTEIKDRAFRYCNLEELTLSENPDYNVVSSNLVLGGTIKKLNIPDNVTTLEDYALVSCKINNLLIGSGVQTISSSAFDRYSNITNIQVNENKNISVEKKGLYANSNKDLHYILPDAKELTLSSNIENIYAIIPTTVTSLMLPKNIKNIPNLNGYAGTVGIEEENKYTIKDGVIYTSDMATIVTGTGSMPNEFVCPATVTSINSEAFYNNKKITKADLSLASIKELPSHCFNTTNLNEIIFNNNKSLIAINHWCFANAKLKTVEIPEGVTKIQWAAFNSNLNLTSIKIPSTIQSMGNITPGCTALNTIEIAENDYYMTKNNAIYSKDEKTLVAVQKYTDNNIFNGVEKVESFALCYFAGEAIEIKLPESVKYISNEAFHDFKRLTKITIPSSVTSIGSRAFGSCSNLKTMDVYMTEEEGIKAGAPWGNPNGIKSINWLG